MNKETKLVLVVWDDAWQDQENFATAHGIRATHAPMKVETLGWLIEDNELGISVANEHSVQDGTDVFRGRTMIPRAMVKDVIEYKLTLPRKKKKATEQPVTSPEQPLQA